MFEAEEIVELLIHLRSRTCGAPKIAEFHRALMLLRMVWFAFLRIKAQ